MQEAIALAVSEHNAVAGAAPVQYLPLDDSDPETGDWSPQRESANASAAANDASVVAYIGPYNSGAAMLSLPITNRAGLLQASPSATWPGLTLEGWDAGEPAKYYPAAQRTFVRMMPPDSAQADAAARWIRAGSLSSILIVEDGSSYSAGLADEFETAAGSLAIKIERRVKLTLSSPATLPAEISHAPAIFYAPSSVGNAITLAKALGSGGPVIFSTDTALSPQFLDATGASSRNWNIVSNSAPPGPDGRYSAQGTSTTFDTQFASNAYTLARVILDGVSSGTGRDRAAMVRYVLNARTTAVNDSQSLFTSAGDPVSWLLSGYVIRDGKFVLSKTFASDRLQAP